MQSILLSVINKERTGEGQKVENNLLGSTLYNMSYASGQYLLSGESYKRKGNEHAVIVPYSVYKVGGEWLVLGVATDLQFAKLAAILQIPLDKTNLTNQDRQRNRLQINRLIQT